MSIRLKTRFELCAVITLSLFAANESFAKDRAECERAYKPTFGQPGKDVAWEPTSALLAADMLKMAKTTSRDRVYDLGAGDGAIVIVAAKEFGATAIGIEYNPALAKLGQCFVEAAGVADKAKVVEGDIFKTDFSSATVVTLFLVPELNLRLRPTLLKMPPGTRVVSHMHKMYEWEWDEEVERDGEKARLWIVPANVRGGWTFKQSAGPTQGPSPDSFTLVLNQEFQKLSGNLQVAANRTPVSGKIRGAEIAMDLGARGKLTGKVEKGRIIAAVSDGAAKKEYVGVESRETKGG